MKNKTIKLTVLFAALFVFGAVLGYFGAELADKKHKGDMGEMDGMNNSTMRMPEGYVPTDIKTVGKNIWKGTGFEPGFAFNINKDEANNNYPTELAFQNDGAVDGYLNLKSSSPALTEYEGNLMVGGDAAVPAKIQITNKKCTNASGTVSNNTVKIVFGDTTYNGCADATK